MDREERLREFASEMYEVLCGALDDLHDAVPCDEIARSLEHILRRIDGCELRECPFCGSERVGEYTHENLYGVMCADCQGSSGMSDTPEGARENWNRRCFSEAEG